MNNFPVRGIVFAVECPFWGNLGCVWILSWVMCLQVSYFRKGVGLLFLYSFGIFFSLQNEACVGVFSGDQQSEYKSNFLGGGMKVSDEAQAVCLRAGDPAELFLQVQGQSEGSGAFFFS